MEHPVHINWWIVALVPGNALAVEAIVRQAAVDVGFNGVVSLCDRIAKVLTFLLKIANGLIKLKLGGPNGQTSAIPAGSGPAAPGSPSTDKPA